MVLLIDLSTAQGNSFLDWATAGGSTIVVPNPATNVIPTTIGELATALFSYYCLAPALSAYPPTGLAAAMATAASANSAVGSLAFPQLNGGFQFQVTCTNATIAHGSSGTVTATLALVDPGYSGTVTFSVSSPGAIGITAVFSPTSLSAAGTSTGTISVTSGTPPGSYVVEIIGTDGTGLTNNCYITIVVT